jgi:hypothetical protein
MRLVALDCDGTLIYSNGPIDPIFLREKGWFTVLVSSSGKCKGKEGFDDIIPSTGGPPYPSRERKESLIKVKEKYPNAQEYVYISDNIGDDVISIEVGFKHFHPMNIKEFYGEINSHSTGDAE